MESILLSSKKKSDLRLLLELAKKMGIKTHSISRADLEDWALAKSIKAGLKTVTVSKEDVLKVLRK